MIGMDMGRILTIFNSMKNVNMSGTPAAEEPVEEIETKPCAECVNCSGTGHLDLGWGETVPCLECQTTGKILEYSDGVDSGPIGDSGAEDEGPAGKYGAGEMWQKDEMDFPPESFFKTKIAGEKKSDQDVNDHDLTVDDQLIQDHLEEGTDKLDEEREMCRRCGNPTTAPGIGLCDDCYKTSYEHSMDRVNQVTQKRRAGDRVVETAPPDQEDWVKKNKSRFKKEYGDKKGEEVLYATAWKNHNKKKTNEGENTVKKTVDECNGCSAGAPAQDRDAVSVNASYNSDMDEKSVTVTARNGSADELMHILKLSGIMPGEEKTEIAPEPQPAAVTGLSAVVVGEGKEEVAASIENKKKYEHKFKPGKSGRICVHAGSHSHCGKVADNYLHVGSPKWKADNDRLQSKLNEEFHPDLHDSDAERDSMFCDRCFGYHDGPCKEETNFEGLCDHCGDNEAIDGTKFCRDCHELGFGEDWYQEQLEKEMAERDPFAIHEGHIYELDTPICSNCGSPREAGIHSGADEEKLCADCYKYAHMDELTNPADEGAYDFDRDTNWEPDDFEEMNRNEANDYTNESKLNETSGYYVTGYTLKSSQDNKFRQCFVKLNLEREHSLSPNYILVFGKQFATIFDDLNEAKKAAANAKSIYKLHSVSVKPQMADIIEFPKKVQEKVTKMNESLSPKRENTGLNGAPKTWQNEPNEQMAGWKALVQDTEGLSQPHDMFNAVKGSDNIMTVASKKRETEKPSGDFAANAVIVSAIAEKLQKKFDVLEESDDSVERMTCCKCGKNTSRFNCKCGHKICSSCKEAPANKKKTVKEGTLTEDRCISCDARIPSGSDIDQCKKCYKKDHPEEGKSKKKVTEANSSKAVNCCSCGKNGIAKKSEKFSKSHWTKAPMECKSCGHKICTRCKTPKKKVTEDESLSIRYSKNLPEKNTAPYTLLFTATDKSGVKKGHLGIWADSDQEAIQKGIAKIDQENNYVGKKYQFAIIGIEDNFGSPRRKQIYPDNKVEESTASKVAKQKEDHPEKYCKTKKCLYRTDADYCPKHKPTKKVNESGNFSQYSDEFYNKVAEQEKPMEEFLRNAGWESKEIVAPNQRKQLMWLQPGKPWREYSTLNAYHTAKGMTESKNTKEPKKKKVCSDCGGCPPTKGSNYCKKCAGMNESKLGDLSWQGKNPKKFWTKITYNLDKILFKLFWGETFPKDRPHYDTKTITKYLKDYNLSDEQIKNIRLCAITAMKSAIKDAGIPDDKVYKLQDSFTIYNFIPSFNRDEERQMRDDIDTAARHKFELLLKKYGHELTESTMKPIEVTEEVSKSSAKKLQAALDNLEQKVKKLGAPPSPQTKITQSMERFTDKIAAIKAALAKRKGEDEEESSEDEKPKAKKSEGDGEKSEKKPFEKKEKSEKSEPDEEGKEAEPKPKEQKETASNKPNTNGDDKAPVGKVKDIGKGIYESEVEKMQGFRSMLVEGFEKE